MSDYKELLNKARLYRKLEHSPIVLSVYDAMCDVIEQLVRERDAAVEAAENIHSDFVDYVCSGRNNIAPYCGNRCADCTDVFGLCKPQSKFCNGFISKEYTEWRGAQDETD